MAASENEIIFKKTSGHNHDGESSSIIDTTKYSLYDFAPQQISPISIPRKALQAENESLIKNMITDTVKERINIADGLKYITSGTFNEVTAQLTYVFSNDYDNYKIILSNLQHADANEFFLIFNLLADTTSASTNYAYSISGYTFAGASTSITSASQIFAVINSLNNSADNQTVIDICRPYAVDSTTFSCISTGYAATYSGGGRHSTASSYNGIQFSTFRLGATSSTLTGSYAIYGYKK